MKSEIIQLDRNLRPVSLSSFRGKFILLHFWASWSGISRRDIPLFKTLQHKFKDKNFGIVGIALDNEREQWLRAIDEEETDWTHLSDLRYWSNRAASEFGIHALPGNILLDTTGEVLTRNLEPGQLNVMLDYLVNEHYSKRSLVSAR